MAQQNPVVNVNKAQQTPEEIDGLVMRVAKYQIEEEIFADDSGGMYPAKVLERELVDEPGPPAIQYKVHYKGWKSKWDCWKQEDELMPKNKETTLKWKESKKNKKSGVKRSRTKAQPNQAKKRIRRYETEKMLFVDLAASLKKLLQEDERYIKTRGKLHKIPTRNHTVSKILKDFVGDGHHNNRIKAHVPEMVSGLEDFFQQALINNLLYKEERTRYKTYFSSELAKKPSQAVGFIFLLRLLVKAPMLASYDHVTENQAMVVRETLRGLGRFLKKNVERYSESLEFASSCNAG